MRREPASTDFLEGEIPFNDRVANRARPVRNQRRSSDGLEGGLKGQIASNGGTTRVIGHDSSVDEIVGIEIKGRHRDVDLESGLVVLLDVEMFLLGLTLGRHADGPLAKGGLVRQGVVQADGTEIGLQQAQGME